MKNFDTRVYSISDFLEWENSDLLELNPDFQRRAVWSETAKSYLVDTILRGKPMPKIIISQKLEGARNIRVVVDGQQRLRAILGFINGDFKISRAHNKELAGYTFDRLPADYQKSYYQYELGVDVIFDLAYEDVLDIFQRINSYTVTLNAQEKINAKYLGYFKQYVFEYGRKYVKYFIEGGIITKAQVTRMAEAELSANLFVALIDGIQTNKNNEQYYKKYDDEIGNIEEVAEHFDEIMSYLGAIYSLDQLVETNWSRIHLFYTLFTTIGHCLYNLTGPDPNLRVPINKNSIGKLRVQFDEISSRYDDVAAHIDDENYPADYKHFVDLSRRRTTDTLARIDRTNFVCEKLSQALK
jgi:hypothetical protein